MRISDWSSDVCSSDLWKTEKARLRAAGSQLDDPELEARLQIKERWAHKKFGTPETWERDGVHTDCLIQLEKNGTLTADQIEWAAEISVPRSEEHTSELQSLMRISYAVFCLKKKKKRIIYMIKRQAPRLNI